MKKFIMFIYFYLGWVVMDAPLRMVFEDSKKYHPAIKAIVIPLCVLLWPVIYFTVLLERALGIEFIKSQKETRDVE